MIGDQPVCELNSSGAVSATNTWAGGLISRNSDGTSTFYTWDTSGNIVQRLDGSGNVIGTYAVDAYGARTGTDSTTDPYANFGGEYGYYADAESGLELLGHRYYDSGTGRFINRDPISYSGGPDIYEFANNNPITFCDPTGFDPYMVFTVPDVEQGLEVGWSGFSTAVWTTPGLQQLNDKYCIFVPHCHDQPGYMASVALGRLGVDAAITAGALKLLSFLPGWSAWWNSAKAPGAGNRSLERLLSIYAQRNWHWPDVWRTARSPGGRTWPIRDLRRLCEWQHLCFRR